MKELLEATHECRPDAGEQATIRTLYLITLLKALANVGRRLDPLLREHGLYRSQAATPYERIALGRYVSLIEQAAQRFDRPFLGLDMGTQFGLEELGPFHTLFKACANLDDALDCVMKFQMRWQTRSSMELVRGPQVSVLSYRIQEPGIWPRRQDAEFTLSGIVGLIKQLLTTQWAPVQVHFEHSTAGREQHLERFFKAPVRGHQGANQLVVLNSDLARPFPRAAGGQDIGFKRVLERHLLDLLGPENTTTRGLAMQARELIARRLGRTAVDCDSIAAALDLSSRSLRRRLVEEGSSFRSLLKEVRQAKAQNLLQACDMSLSAVAQDLGYSDQATFSRAFKEWTRVSPRRYSRRHDQPRASDVDDSTI
ncbi:AraC family transcriptional regulator ligand-binding domain-containing protein [Pseudomonas sp. KCJK8993]|uniref:AraC-like transcriptional regulator QhpR n=1 Tax=Pseudomonas sp. KCJK8993 TaxID=3344565 RepID=UPI0039060C75